MGSCSDCIYFSSDTAGFLQRHYCQYHTSGDKYFFVSDSGTCPRFSPKSTRSDTGYKGGSGACFLTSACVEYLGKADDCEELTALRAFRDGYMKSFDEGKKLVEEYYEVAPKIVEKINLSGRQDYYYGGIYEVVLRCVKLISEKDNEKVFNEYKAMVEKLKKEFAL